MTLKGAPAQSSRTRLLTRAAPIGAATVRERLRDPSSARGCPTSALLLLLALTLHASDSDALYQAVWRDDVAAVQTLIRSGADPKAPNLYGVTPLSLACTNGDTAM